MGTHSPSPAEELIARAESALAQRLTPRVFEHSMGVATTAMTMATLYSVDPIDAYLAGLLHDWDRCASFEDLLSAAYRYGIEVSPELAASPRLLHAHTGAFGVAETFPELSDSIIDAVAHHTVGVASMSDLDMVIYVADMIEPTRAFSKVDDLREMVGTVELRTLFKQAYQHTLHHLVSNSMVIHPDTLKVWNSLAM